MCYEQKDKVKQQRVEIRNQEIEREENREPDMIMAGPVENHRQEQAPEADILRDFEVVEWENVPRDVRERLNCRIVLSPVIDERKDSSYMQEVKRAINALSDLTDHNLLENMQNRTEIHLKEDGDALHERLNEIESKYMAAIEKCKLYLEKREPSFLGSKTRYNMVKNTMNLLEQELTYLTKLRLDMTTNPENFEGKTNMSFLDLIHTELIQKKPDQEINRLELKDFAQMITQNEEESILCRNGKLYRKGEAKTADDQGAVTRENYQMADHMVQLLLKRQEISGPEEMERMRRNLLRGLGVDVKNQVSAPVSMYRIRNLLVKFNRYTSKVDQVLHEQKSNAKLSKDKQSLEYRSANQINELLGNAFDDKLTKKGKKIIYTRKSRAFQDFLKYKILRKKKPAELASLELKAKIKEQIKSALATCEKNKDWTVLKPSKEDLEILLHGRLQAVRDKTFEMAQRIYAGRQRLSKEPMQELDNSQMQELMGLVLTEAMAGSESAKYAAGLQLQKYIESRILNADLELEKSLGAMNIEEFEGMAVSTIRNYVLSNSKSWQDMNPKDRETALAAVLRIVANTQEIRLLSHKGLVKGLSEEETEIFEKRAEESYALYVANEGQIEKLREGFPANSAIHQGLAKMKMKKLSHFGAMAAKVAAEKFKNEEALPAEEKKKKAPVEMLTETEALKYAMYDFDEKSAVVMTALFLEQAPSKLIHRPGDRRSTEILQLHDALRSMALCPENQKKAENTVRLNGVEMRIKQDEAGILTLTVKGKEVTLPRNASYLADMLELNLCDHFDQYNEKQARNVLLQKATREDDKYSPYEGSRVIYERFLTYHVGITAEKLANVDAYVLRNLTKKYCMNPKLFNKKEIMKLADAYANRQVGKVHVNSSAAIENLIALENLRKQKEENQEQGEEHKQNVAKPLAVQDQKEWSPEEKCYLNLISDLLFMKKAKDVQDLNNPLTAESLKSVLRTRKKELVTILNMNQLERASILVRLNAIPHFGKAASAADGLIHKLIKQEKTGRSYNLGIFLAGQAEEKNIDKALDDPELAEGLETCANQMKEAVNDASDFIQKQLKTVADSLDDGTDEGWKNLNDYTIGELVQKGITGDEGEGAFNRKVLSGYVKKAAFSDKVRMFSAAIRNMPKLEKEDLKKLGEEGIAAKIMAGYIKGAGPLLHKMMQGLPVSSMDESMQKMVSDVRSRLMEIDEDLVDGQLQQIIRESNGSIERIEKIKVLGAASVGQTVLVKVFEKGRTEGVEKVVKILRPDVQNYMEREKAFMEECAKEVDKEAYIKKHNQEPAENFKGGMLKTYLNKEKAILRELDLRLEADNVEKGSIYEDELLHIRSMKLDKNTKSTIQTIVLEKAEGISVDKFMENKNADRDKVEKKATKPEDKSKVSIYQTVEELSEIRKDLVAKQKYLINLTSKWLDEAIFNTGFFHGDLHAGNVMIDDEGVTIIDYGNASKLSPKEQTDILNILAAAAKFNEERVADHIRSMLSPEAKRIYDSKKNTLEQNIRTIVKKEGGMPVQTVLAVLNELQKEEIEIPEGFYNFIQCFVRIFGTLTDYKNLIDNVDESIGNVMRSEQQGEVADNPENDIMAMIMNQLLVRVDKKKENRPEAEESLENIVKAAMESKEVNMKSLLLICDKKHDPGYGAFEQLDQEKMKDVTDLLKKIKTCYEPLFMVEEEVTAIHDLKYAEKFDIADAKVVADWFEKTAKVMINGAIISNIINLIESQEKVIAETMDLKEKEKENADVVGYCDFQIKTCEDEIARLKSKQDFLQPKFDQLAEKISTISDRVKNGELDREAMKATFEDCCDMIKEVMYLEAKDNDNDEREFISSFVDLSMTTRPREQEKISDKLKEDRETFKSRMERIANVIHKRSNPMSYKEEMTEAVIKDESYEKLGGSLKDWFEDSKIHGEELRTAYLNLGAAKKKGPVNKETPEVVAFMEALQASLTARCAQIEKIANEKNLEDESGSEEKAIGDLLRSNLVMSMLSLDYFGLAYLSEQKMEDGEKQRIANDRKHRKSNYIKKFYESLSKVHIKEAVEQLSRATKQYNQVMSLLYRGGEGNKPEEKEIEKAIREINEAFNGILRQIAKIEFYPGEQKKIDKYFKALENEPSISDIMRMLRGVGRYIEDALDGTIYTDVKENNAERDIDTVYDNQMKDWDIVPRAKYLGKLVIEEQLGADNKPISIKERLKNNEKIQWVQRKNL